MKLMYRKEKIEEATNILMLPLTSGKMFIGVVKIQMIIIL